MNIYFYYSCCKEPSEVTRSDNNHELPLSCCSCVVDILYFRISMRHGTGRAPPLIDLPQTSSIGLSVDLTASHALQYNRYSSTVRNYHTV